MFITLSLKWYLYHHYHVKNDLDIELLLNLKKCHNDVIRRKIRCRYPYVITSTLLQIRSTTAYITSLCFSFGDVSPYVCSYYFQFGLGAEWPHIGKKLLTRLTICSLCILTICNFSYFPSVRTLDLCSDYFSS